MRWLQSFWDWGYAYEDTTSPCDADTIAAFQEMHAELPSCGLMLAEGITNFTAAADSHREYSITREDIMV